ncbi:MFS transporter [Longispora sp. NPDC051575]|uniref:MFS transporter n=1 Tax=Longispora sp. NPDC051575 TaxID=3154943 RepID=UPI00342B2697
MSTVDTAARAGLWSRNFSLYFLARSVSLLGDAMLPVVTALAVGELYGASGVGFVLAAWMVPFVALVLFGGVLADRFSPRRMMIGADVVRIVTQGGTAVAFFLGTPSLALLLVAGALSGAAAAMFQPGVNGMIPLVATDPQRANATIKVADAMAQLLGPGLAGLLIVLTGAGTVYTIDAATYLVSALALLALRLGPVPLAAAGSSMLRNLGQGWREFRSRTWMWSVILIWTVYGVALFGPLIPLGSTLVSGRLGAPAYGWIMSSLGAGTIIGGLIALRLKPARPLAAGAVGMFGFALIPLTIATHAPLPVLVAGHVGGGMAWAFWSVMWSTSVQTQVSPEVLNRVTAYEIAGSVASIPLGQALAGPVAGAVGAENVLGVSVLVSVVGCVVLLVVPAIRRLRRVPLPAVARAEALACEPG